MSYDTEHNIDRTAEDVRRMRRLSYHVRRILQNAALFEDPYPEGMRQEFVDSLDRISKHHLSHEEECPICASPFLDDPYPLVVTLPCPGRHRFDLECVAKWLKSSGTCPMCRHDFNKAAREKCNANAVEGDEDAYDDMYS